MLVLIKIKSCVHHINHVTVWVNKSNLMCVSMLMVSVVYSCWFSLWDHGLCAMAVVPDVFWASSMNSAGSRTLMNWDMIWTLSHHLSIWSHPTRIQPQTLSTLTCVIDGNLYVLACGRAPQGNYIHSIGNKYHLFLPPMMGNDASKKKEKKSHVTI